MTVPYIIIDDEALGRENLRLALAAHAGWTLVGEYASAAAARAGLAEHEVDVVFLDIQMPGESGLTLARELSQWCRPPLIIFVTAYSAHAVEAFEVHALDYLLKPLNDERLAQATDRAWAMLRSHQHEAYGAALRDFVRTGDARRVEHVSVRSVGRIEQIPVGAILWAESAGNYVQLHLASRSVLHRITLNRLEALLGSGEYVRVHRGTVVRRDQIGRLENVGQGHYRLSLQCGGVVVVSERYVGHLKTCM